MRIESRSAKFDFSFQDSFEAGVILTGAEVKSIFLRQASLEGAYVKIIDNEAFLVNAHIHPYKFADLRTIDPKRSRKLLLNRKELLAIEMQMKAKDLTLIPVAWYTKGAKIKLEIALAKGKKKWEKREQLKKKDQEREAEEVARGKR